MDFGRSCVDVAVPGRGRWSSAGPLGVVILTTALIGAGVNPPEPTPAAAEPRSTTAIPPPSRTVLSADAIMQGAAAASAEAEATMASAEAVAAAVAAVDAIGADDRIQMGAAVLDRTTGELAVGAWGAIPIAAASMVKLYTVVDVLGRSSAGELTLTDADRRTIDRALRVSDDNAMNALWSRFGGVATVSATAEAAGLHDSGPPADPSQWGEALVSARDVVAVFDYVLTEMSPADRDTVMGPLSSAVAPGADGFDQAFGLLAPPRRPEVAAKQGWMWFGSTFYLHTAGTLGPDDRYVVAILSTSSAGSRAARTTVDQAAAAVVDTLLH